MIKTVNIEYKVDGKTFTGYLADGSKGKAVPGILVAHEGGGMTNHPQERARMLAELGYVAFAMDTFGEKITSREQAMSTIMGLMQDLPTLRKRARTALDVLKAQPGVDAMRSAAIGFCFGGTTALELARSGADVGCVVGFHSGLQTGAPQDAKNIKGKVLVCLGAADPIIPPEQREAFVKEMEAGKVDWRMELYGAAGHSFTNREVDAMNIPGFAYHQKTDERSWRAMRALFDETLGPL
ncbi:MAG: dienelactone hydrolase family protein [Alphaproteobacteria bacterium]|nr:dienelactone hydrolase family protein [Alphaproteobacteria bacterium]